MEPLPRTKHHVTIEFDLEVAPELAKGIRQAIGDGVFAILGYPYDVLATACLSFDKPRPPEKIQVRIEPV